MRMAVRRIRDGGIHGRTHRCARTWGSGGVWLWGVWRVPRMAMPYVEIRQAYSL